MEMFEINLTCSYELIDGRNSCVLQGYPRDIFKLEMMIKMVEFSLEKMGIRIGIKRSENQWLLNFDFEDFLDLDGSFLCRGFLLHF